MLTLAQRALLDAKAPNDSLLGAELHKTKNIVKAVYDFAVEGGAVSTIALKDDSGNPVVLPIGAIVTRVFLDIITTFTSGGSATLTLDSQAAADLLASTAVASLAAGLLLGKPIESAATMVKIASTAKPVTATIGTAAMTAGKAKIFIEYVLSDAT